MGLPYELYGFVLACRKSQFFLNTEPPNSFTNLYLFGCKRIPLQYESTNPIFYQN